MILARGLASGMGQGCTYQKDGVEHVRLDVSRPSPGESIHRLRLCGELQDLSAAIDSKVVYVPTRARTEVRRSG